MIYLEVKNYTKTIKGNIILDDINLKLERGKIYGVVGRNGSGKTMLFRAISGLIKPTKGSVLIDGKELFKDMDFPESCGITIESPGFWSNQTAKENLLNLASIKNIIGIKDIERALIRVGLDPNDNRKINKYSMGMKQKLALAQAFMEKPDIILLDEPTNALDDESVNNIRTILKEEKARGACILIASHNKEDIELLADDCLKIVGGKI